MSLSQKKKKNELKKKHDVQALNVLIDFSDIPVAESSLWYMQDAFMLNYEI